MGWRKEQPPISCLIVVEITLLQLTSRSVKLHRFGNQKIVLLQPVGHDLLPLSILPRSITSFQCERANFVTYLSHEPTHVPCLASLLPLPRSLSYAATCRKSISPISASSNLLEEPSFWLLTLLVEVIERCINCRYNISPVYTSFHFLRILPFLTRIYPLLYNERAFRRWQDK